MALHHSSRTWDSRMVEVSVQVEHYGAGNCEVYFPENDHILLYSISVLINFFLDENLTQWSNIYWASLTCQALCWDLRIYIYLNKNRSLRIWWKLGAPSPKLEKTKIHAYVFIPVLYMNSQEVWRPLEFIRKDPKVCRYNLKTPTHCWSYSSKKWCVCLCVLGPII
jgi:hypothetical protein